LAAIMTKRRTVRTLGAAALAVAVLATAAAAGAGAAAAGRAKGLRGLGLRIYRSVLREDQKPQAKKILADFLVDAAPERLAAFSAWTAYRAEVAAVLTPAQRRKAWALKRKARAWSPDQRRTHVDAALDGTNRGVLADRVAALRTASPESRASIRTEIQDQLYEAIVADLGPRLDLNETQRRTIRARYDAFRERLQPIAKRLAAKRAVAVRKALDLLDADQRERIEVARDTVMEKLLAFLRGSSTR